MLALTLAATATTTACGSSGGGSDSDVRFVLTAGQRNVYTTGYDVLPQELGYWREEGIDVEVNYANGGNAGMQLVSAGKADIVLGGLAAFLSAPVGGRELVTVSAWPQNIYRVVVPASGDIESIEDLDGATVGVLSQGSVSELMTRAMLKEAGVDDENVTFLPVGQGAQAAQALKSGEIDAYSIYDGGWEVVESLLGKKLVPLVWRVVSDFTV